MHDLPLVEPGRRTATPSNRRPQSSRRTRLRVVPAIAVVVVMALFGTACEQLHDDNRAAPIFGASNGQLPSRWLVDVNGCTVYWEAAVSLRLMTEAAARDGVTLTPISCYRDYAGQVSARNYWCGLNQCHMAAVPGSSNHGWGKAVDFRNGSSPMTYDSKGFEWLTAYAWHYGWFHPKVMRQGGPVPEPWHWEWIGDGGKMFHGKYFGFGNGLPLKGSPIGNLDIVTPGSGTARLQGWTFDPDQQDPIDVHVYVDGRWGGAHRAGTWRGDVAAAYPAYASRPHGYDLTLSVGPGRRQICVYGIETYGTGTNVLLGCRTVDVPAGSAPAVEVPPTTTAPTTTTTPPATSVVPTTTVPSPSTTTLPPATQPTTTTAGLLGD